MSENDFMEFNVAFAVSTVAEGLRNSHGEPQESAEFLAAVQNLNAYFGTTDRETWLLSVIIHLQIDGSASSFGRSERRFRHIDGIGFRELAEFLDYPVLKTTIYRPELNALLAKHFIINSANFNRQKIGENNRLVLTPEVRRAVLLNEKPEAANWQEEKETLITALSKISGLMREDNDIDDTLYSYIRYLEDTYADEPVVKTICQALPGQEHLKERIFAYFCCAEYADGDEVVLHFLVKSLYRNNYLEISKKFMDESHELISKGLIEFTKKDIFTEAEVSITAMLSGPLLGDYGAIFQKIANGADVIRPEKIREKALFYSAENETEVKRLTTSLQEENLQQITGRLLTKGYPQGIAILFYGAPGTGKTETALQIARATGREIIHVDISRAKSAWFGESEKKVKQIFNNYKKICDSYQRQKRGKMPILLFNEADAIFSKRKDVTTSNVAQTENAIQNIILEELERSEGIIMATTNLIGNLDEAFERRFLFKIRFDKPSVEAKKKIWKSKLEWLSEEEVNTFASGYDLSGGQIDNIVRKVTMDEVISGERPTISELCKLCKNEKLGEKERVIGFF